jgi:hypothetical protein
MSGIVTSVSSGFSAFWNAPVESFKSAAACVFRVTVRNHPVLTGSAVVAGLGLAAYKWNVWGFGDGCKKVCSYVSGFFPTRAAPTVADSIAEIADLRSQLAAEKQKAAAVVAAYDADDGLEAAVQAFRVVRVDAPAPATGPVTA